MGNRILRDWTASTRIDKLSEGAEVFFTRLIMKVDDYGNIYAHRQLLKSALYPLKDKVKIPQIDKWINECITANVIKPYSVSGKEYLQIIDFGQRLDRARAKYPSPEDQDLIGYVYLIESGEIHKIGFSLNPWARVKEIKSPIDKPVVLTMTFKGSAKEEKELHSLLREFNYENEWFTLPKECLSVFISTFEAKKSAYDLIVAVRSYRSPAESESESEVELEPEPEVEEKEVADALLSLGGFAKVWNEWEQHRKEKRAPLTPSVKKKQLKFLARWPPEEAIAIIEQSLLQGWTGLFELKNKSHEHGIKPTGTLQPTTAIIQPDKSFGVEKGFSRSGSN